MKQLDIVIRNESANDYSEILKLTYKAFQTVDYPGRRRMDEHFLISLLKESDYVIPELCFVAEYEGEIAGHILYTKSKFKRPDGSKADTITFGPLSVLPKYQKRGVGKALVRHSMEKAQEMGHKAVLITGIPDYYPKLGFKRSGQYGLFIENYPIPDAFMAYELIPGYLDGGGIYYHWAPEFDTAENDDAGYENFHRRFMFEYFPGELIQRTLYDNDVSLMEKWLCAEHIAPWYEQPNDWLNEIRNRRDEFSFLSHMIVEIDGKSIGFCQYYDCFDARNIEDWGIPILAAGEVYSIDYLIGEPEYLQRGFGKEIIRQLVEILRNLGAKKVIVQPDSENKASCQSLVANGFIKEDNYYSLELEKWENEGT